MRSHALIGSLFGAGIIATAAPARAWYFPEHAELTRLALQDYAPAFVTERLTLLIEEARAGATGVPGFECLCPGASTTLLGARDTQGNVCVPYGALPALAADHANTWSELRDELLSSTASHSKQSRWRPFPGVRAKEPLAVSLTEAAINTWDSFEKSAPRELVEVWIGGIDRLATPKAPPAGSASPRDYVRSLDAALFVLDPEYTSRAAGAKTHFHDAMMSVTDVLQQAIAGDFNNALAQFVAHHLKSLELAVSARSAQGPTRRKLQNAALLEHAFALHFLEDGLVGGHIATGPAFVVDEHRAQRHDYFNRQGLAVRRNLASEPCDPMNERVPSRRYSMGLAPCWVAHGDGFATFVDRAYVGEAVARAQTSFALALSEELSERLVANGENAEDCKAWRKGGLPGLGCDLAWTAFLLDPFPEWSSQSKRTESPDPAPWARSIVERHERALERLRHPIGHVNAGSARAQPHKLPLGIFDHVFAGDEAALDAAATDDPGLVLIRPLLVAWPATQADITTLEGGDVFHRGWQLHAPVNVAFGWANPFDVDAATSVWVGGGVGIGYAAHGIFPTRVNRTLFELNAGAAQGYYLAGSEVPFRSLGVTELRAPVSTMLVYGAAWALESRKPLELLGDSLTWGLLGGRLYWTLSKDMDLSGWDVEVANLYLGTPGSKDAALSGITATELRLRLGWRSPYFIEMSSPFDGFFFLAVELSSGFYTTI